MEELQDNPALEIDEEAQRLIRQREADNKEVVDIRELYKIADDPIYDNTLRRSSHYEETPVSRAVSLTDHLLRQLRIELTDQALVTIGEEIIENLDEDGYLRQDINEIARRLNLSRPEDASKVLEIIQRFDPVGVAARTPEECLWIQADARQIPYKNLVKSILVNHFQDMCHKRFDVIARQLKVSLDTVREVVAEIAKLDPKPARNFTPADNHIYIKPDIIIEENRGKLEVRINSDGIPPLRISSSYRQMLNKGLLTPQERHFLSQHIASAVNFIKSISQREETMSGIARTILRRQKRFFTEGAAGLTPMTMRDVADEIKRDESTVSRAIRNKYIDTPQGIFPVRYFFSGSIQSNGNGTVATRFIKETIRELVDNEDKTRPLSDQDIVTHFAKSDIPVARRTVAKYRKLLKIPPSHLRKE